MSFQIPALPAAQFAPLFDLPDAILQDANARLVSVAENPGIPCRVSLADAEIGEVVLLVNYEHQPENSPYKASHAVYVRKGVATAKPNAGEVPDVLKRRPISIRAFDGDHMMTAADVAEGDALEGVISALLEDQAISYLHLHYAKPGCFAAKVTRA